MHWRLNKYAVEESIKFLRRVFAYNNTWNNVDIEIVNIEKGNNQLIYEQYAQVNEKYPIVLVSPGGGTFIPTGFNDFIRSVDDDLITLGSSKTDKKLINDTFSIKSKIPISAAGSILRGISIESAWTGQSVGGDNISINLYKNYQSASASIVGSASIQGHTSRSFQSSYTEFNQNITLDESPYHLVISSTNESPYWVGIDANAPGDYLYNPTGSDISASGSVVADLLLPPFVRLGGNFKGSLSFRIMSKNDTKTVYGLSELISMYMTLAKHAQISRSSSAIDGMKLSKLDNDFVSEFLSKGIFIDQIRIGSLETRKRSDQEIIYTITVSIDILTEWYQDFPAEAISDINILIRTFIDPEYENVWSSTEI